MKSWRKKLSSKPGWPFFPRKLVWQLLGWWQKIRNRAGTSNDGATLGEAASDLKALRDKHRLAAIHVASDTVSALRKKGVSAAIKVTDTESSEQFLVDHTERRSSATDSQTG